MRFSGVMRNVLERNYLPLKLSRNTLLIVFSIVLAHGDIDAVENTYIFRTYDHYPPPPLSSRKSKDNHRNPGPAHLEEIYKVALATSAAPRYFSKVVINHHEY